MPPSLPPRDPRLHRVVEQLWCAPGQGAGHRDRVVPTGQAHLVWRLGAPIRLVDGPVLSEGALAGPRSAAHLHHTADAWSVGVMLHPDAIPRLFGVAASEVAERHLDLGALVGADAGRLQARLEEVPALETVEAWLAARLAPSRAPAGLDLAIRRLARGDSVASTAAAVGRSPRTLRLWFDEGVGLSPAAWRAVRRVRRAMDLAAREPDGARVAALAGFADQDHLCREFKAVAGIPLSAWRHHRPGEPSHVREPAADSSKCAAARPR